MTHNPTEQAYGELQAAYDYFNRELFDGGLPDALISFQRKPGSAGHFAADRYATRDGTAKHHELGLNPSVFKHMTPEDILSTVVHEQVHAWQKTYGDPGRPGYHNREWANKMLEIGLIPTSTGKPGGNQTGQRIDHLIQPGGKFQRAAQKFLETSTITYVDLSDAGKAKSASKTKFTCVKCSANAWGAPGLHLLHLGCNAPMLSAEQRRAQGHADPGPRKQSAKPAKPILLEGTWPLLGIPRSASERQIKAAYKRKSKICHPDTGGDHAAFIALTKEYGGCVGSREAKIYLAGPLVKIGKCHETF